MNIVSFQEGPSLGAAGEAQDPATHLAFGFLAPCWMFRCPDDIYKKDRMPWATVLKTVVSGLKKKQGLCLYLIVGAREWGGAPEARDGGE